MLPNSQKTLVLLLILSFSQYLFNAESYTFQVENELEESLKEKKGSETEVSKCVVSSCNTSHIHHNSISFQIQYISVQIVFENISVTCERSPPLNV